MIRFIRRVEFCPATRLAAAAVVNNTILIDSEETTFTTLPVIGLSAIETSGEKNAGTWLFTAKLTCILEQRITLPCEELVFRLTATDGQRFLLGNGERPFPLILQTDSMPARASERSACTLTASLTSEHPLLKWV